jgi:hypothetical protein
MLQRVADLSCDELSRLDALSTHQILVAGIAGLKSPEIDRLPGELRLAAHDFTSETPMTMPS